MLEEHFHGFRAKYREAAEDRCEELQQVFTQDVEGVDGEFARFKKQ